MADTDRQTAEGKVLWHFTMSLDGFVAGPNHAMDWMTGISSRPGLVEEYVETTGAVLVGRDGFDAHPDVSGIYGGAWQGPVFVLTHHPDDAPRADGVTFLSCEVAEASRIGLEAADGKNLEVFSPHDRQAAPRARSHRRDRPAHRAGAPRRRDPAVQQPWWRPCPARTGRRRGPHGRGQHPLPPGGDVPTDGGPVIRAAAMALAIASGATVEAWDARIDRVS